MKNNKIVAIHQPNFFPWLGYFYKIIHSDTFIVLDDVQFQKKGGNHSNHVKILINGVPKYITMPVERNYSGTKIYSEIQIKQNDPWKSKTKKTLELNYSKAPFFKTIFPVIESIFECSSDKLIDFNICAIKSFMELLKVDLSKIVLSSSLNSTGQSTERLVSLVNSVDGTIYLTGGGAHKYQEDNLFHESNIEPIYMNFNHPEYKQFNNKDFIPGLSIIDALMNCELDELMKLLTNQSIISS